VFVLPFGENFIVVGFCMFVDIIPQRDRQTTRKAIAITSLGRADAG